MKREIDMKEISDGKLYGPNDLVKADVYKRQDKNVAYRKESLVLDQRQSICCGACLLYTSSITNI